MAVEEQVREALAAQRPLTGPEGDVAGAAVRGARRRIAARGVGIVATVAAVAAAVVVAVPMLSNGDGAPATSEATLTELLDTLPMGEPTTLGTFAGNRFATPEGRVIEVPTARDQMISFIEPVPTGWVVHLNGSRGGETVLFVDLAGTSREIATGDGLFATVNRDGDRIAIGQTSGIRVLSLATGAELGSTPRLPRNVQFIGWSRDKLVLLAGSTFGPVTIGLWDPATGPYTGGVPELAYLPAGAPGSSDDLLAITTALAEELCVVRLSVDDLSVRDEVCGGNPASFAVNTPRQTGLVRVDLDGAAHAVDVAAAFESRTLDWVRLGLPDPIEVKHAWFENERAVVFEVDVRDKPQSGFTIVRCKLDTGACERVARPDIGNGPATWLWETAIR